MEMEQIISATAGWYAVYNDVEEWCSPILCLGLTGGTVYMLSTDELGLVGTVGDTDGFQGLIYAPHLIYKNRLLWDANGNRADFAHFML